MQEQVVEEKSMPLSIKATKITRQQLRVILQTFLNKAKEHEKQHNKSLTKR